MSLEDSMAKLAAAMDKQADALSEYTAVIKQVGLKALGEDAGENTKTDAPADKKKPGRPTGKTKPKPEPVEEEEEDDGLGGDEGAAGPVMSQREAGSRTPAAHSIDSRRLT